MSRVLKDKANLVTQKYKKGTHNGIDIVGKGYTLDYIVAHSDGVVVASKKDYKYNAPNSNDYGNYVKIKHNNGMYTLYAHMKYNTVTVKTGDKVKKGQVIGYMGNTGHSFGAHLHFEVRDKNNNKIDPTKYINADLPSTNSNNSTKKKYSPGRYEVTCDVLTVRSGAGTEYSWKKFYELTANAQAQIKKLTNTKPNGLVKGCVCDVSKVDDNWGKIPSGWICLDYCKKV